MQAKFLFTANPDPGHKMKKHNKNGAILFDYLNFAKTAGLTKDAELITRRLLDILWVSDTGRFANEPDAIFRAVGKGYSQAKFKNHWTDIMVKAELFKVSENGGWIYCDAILAIKDKMNALSDKRSKAGRKGGAKNAKKAQKPSERSSSRRAAPSMPNSMDENGTIGFDPGQRSISENKESFFAAIKRENTW